MSASGLAQLGGGAAAAAALADAVANPTTVDLATLQLAYNGATWDRQRTPASFHNTGGAGVTAAGSTGVWTPAAGKKFRLMRYIIQITGDATVAAAGRVLVRWMDGAVSMGTGVLAWVPNVALNNGSVIWSTGWVDLGNGYLSVAANNLLNLDLSVALTAGAVSALAIGTEE